MEEKGMTEDEMVGWHHWLDGHEYEQAPGVREGQGTLACCSPWNCKESDTTEWLNNSNKRCGPRSHLVLPWRCSRRMTSAPGIFPDDLWLLSIHPSTGLAQSMLALHICDATSLSVTWTVKSSSAVTIKYLGMIECWNWCQNHKNLSSLTDRSSHTMTNVGKIGKARCLAKPDVCKPSLVFKALLQNPPPRSFLLFPHWSPLLTLSKSLLTSLPPCIFEPL